MSNSPAKNTAAATTRKCISANLKDSNLAKELSVADFMRAFFRNPLDDAACADYIAEDASSLVDAITHSSDEKAAYAPVCELFNGICDKYAEIQGVPDDDQLAFVIHAFHPLIHHPDAYTEEVATQKPDLVVTKKYLAQLYDADVHEWADKTKPRKRGTCKPALSLPLARSFVEGKGDSDPDAHFQAAAYLGSLLMARPDTVGCFGLTIARAYYRMLWCDVSGVYYSKKIPWVKNLKKDRALNILVQYMHQLHTPLLDPSVRLATLDTTNDDLRFDDWRDKSYASPPVWLVRDKPDPAKPEQRVEYVADKILSIGAAWTRKNWVARATRVLVNGRSEPLDPPVIIKDSFILPERAQLCTEGSILDHIHRSGPIPGVVTMRSDFLVKTDSGEPVSNVPLPPDMSDALRLPTRVRYRLFMDAYDTQYIHDSCPSVEDFLMVLYDAIELSRILHEEHGVTHRDISPFNLLRAMDNNTDIGAHASSDRGAHPSSERPVAPNGRVFIRRLLSSEDPAPSPNVPACTLIDFDNAFQKGKETGAVRTAKPAFVARAISQGALQKLFPAPEMPCLDGVAKSLYLQVYGQDQYDLASAFHDGIVQSRKVPITPGVVPHLPRHDAESFYWVTVWYTIMALPNGASILDDNTRRMSAFIHSLESHRVRGGDDDGRRRCFLYDISDWQDLLHPGLHSLAPFLDRLAQLFLPECGWVISELNPYHLHEGMQRLVLEEICRLRSEGNPIAIDTQKQRNLEGVRDADVGLSATAGPVHAARNAKENAPPGSTGEFPQKPAKRSRVASLQSASGPSSRLHGSSDIPSSAASGPSSMPADENPKRRRTAKEPSTSTSASTRPPERQRKQRTRSTNAPSRG